MPTVGEQLRKAREAQNLAVHQVADWTKIRSDHIRALEDGNYSIFSAPVYIRGFVRTYATLLKLDAGSILDQLSKELEGSGQEEPALSQTSHGILDSAMFQFSQVFRRSALPIIGAVVILAIAMTSYLIWQKNQRQNPLEGIGPGLYHAPPEGQTLPLPNATS